MKMAKKYEATLNVKNLLDSQQVVALTILGPKATAPVQFKRIEHFEDALKAEKAKRIDIKDAIPADVKKALGIKEDERKELEDKAGDANTVEGIVADKLDAPPVLDGRRRKKKEKGIDDLKEEDVKENGQKLEDDSKESKDAEPKGEAQKVEDLVDVKTDDKPATKSNRRTAAKDDKKDEGEK